MRALDTNLLVRLIVRDDAQQVDRAEAFFFLRRHPEVVKMHEEVDAEFLAEILAKSRAVGVGPAPKRTKPTE